MRIVALIALLAVGCSEASAFNRRRHGRNVAATSGSAVTIFENYAWTMLYTTDNEGAPWVDSGSAGADVTANTVRATCGAATTGLNDSAIGAAAGNACSFASDNGYKESVAFPTVADGDEIHARVLFKPTSPGVNNYLLYYLKSGSQQFFVRIQGATTGNATFAIGNATSTGCTFTTPAAGNWMLLDVLFIDDNTTAVGCNAAGTCGVKVWVNGTETLCGDATVDYTGMAGAGLWGVSARYDGALSAVGDGVAYGVRIGSSVTMDEATHDADCVAVGICP